MDNQKSSDTLTKLRQQVEYYLSDENLGRDKFFHDKISEDTEVKIIFKIGLFRHRSFT
jgi:hypothetical protein